MIRRTILAAGLLAGLTWALPGQAQQVDPNHARNLAAGCTGCHGASDVGVNGMSALAGRSKDALVQQMQDFGSGKRPATLMRQLAKGYTDAQIEAIASYFAEQRPDKRLP
ncbi:MAG: class I cytochrome c [Burkholderiales bacterium]